MRVSIATEPAPGHNNEDFVAASENAVVLLDGAGLSGVDDGGCSHGVAWYVNQLGAQFLDALSRTSEEPPDVLAEVIAKVAGLHRDTCDLTHPGTPSSTVVAVRLRGDDLEYLVLADSLLVLDRHGEIQVVTDDREAAVGRPHRAALDSLPNGSAAHRGELRRFVAMLRSYRNRPGGFWVAASDPVAAAHSLNGTVALEELRSVTLLSDGASRLADRFGIQTWAEVLSLIAGSGPQALVDAVRAAERSDPEGRRWPRGKTYDDASVVHCDLSSSSA